MGVASQNSPGIRLHQNFGGTDMHHQFSSRIADMLGGIRLCYGCHSTKKPPTREDPNHSIGFKSTKSIFCFLDVFDNSSSRCRRPPQLQVVYLFSQVSQSSSLSLLSLMLYHPVLSLVQLKDGKLMATFNPEQLNVIWGGDHLRYWKMPAK
ncbi:hypothetical protein CK203_058518 [Vitis vinifera]|uniref:Uncharacterized protein n=1 Tax=Vitis vinifera TaxID=29760 RepID=A0A438FQS8_VITVI|nr:hypothetical protein CK203_058518 [Vitis vinifera]